MAEWGKGDPRWIVEEREDGKNVNAWHWEEKDCTKWCRERLEALLKEMPLTSNGDAGDGFPAARVTLNKVSKFEGEVNWYNRKGKLFTLYDLELGVEFSGTVGGDEVAGTLKVQDFEQDAEAKAQFKLTVSKGPADQKWRSWLQGIAKTKFLEVWARVVLELHEEQKARIPALGAQGPAGGGRVKLPEAVQKVASSSAIQRQQQEQEQQQQQDGGKLSFALVFQASPQDLWEMFTSTRRAESYCQAPARVDAKEGGLFSLYDGTISGCFLELRPATQLRMTWRLRDWKEGHSSAVTVSFVREKNGTKLELVQTNVPQADIERTKEGWKRFYFERWKAVFGYMYE